MHTYIISDCLPACCLVLRPVACQTCSQDVIDDWHANTLHVCPLQQEGFASDSVRMIQTLRKEAPNVQILLFSATFSERVKNLRAQGS